MVRYPKSNAGTTLIEVMVAVLIFTIAILGGFSVFVYGRSEIDLQKDCRAAVQLAAQKVEELKASKYEDIKEGETEEEISLGNASYTRTARTDLAGLNKQVRVSVRWQKMNSEHQVSLTTLIAPKN